MVVSIAKLRGGSMGSFSIVHWIIILLVLSPVFATWRIFKRLGLSPWWALFYLVPLAPLVMIWILAYVRWPRLDTETQARAFT